MYRFVLISCICIVMVSCKPTESTTPGQFTGKQLIIMEGGGFTGQTTKTTILENRQVFTSTVNPEGSNPSGMLKRSDTKDLFERAGSLNLQEVDFRHPGNMTYGLIYMDGNNRYEITWGDPSYPAPAEIVEFYQYIRKITSNNP